MILSVRGSLANVRSVLADLTHKGALYGILSGAIFAIAASPSARPPSSCPTAIS